MHLWCCELTPAYLSTIEAQTLVVHGDRDPLYPAELALEMYEAIPESYLWEPATSSG